MFASQGGQPVTTTTVANLYPESTTPEANFPLVSLTHGFNMGSHLSFTTSVVDIPMANLPSVSTTAAKNFPTLEAEGMSTTAGSQQQQKRQTQQKRQLLHDS